MGSTVHTSLFDMNTQTYLHMQNHVQVDIHTHIYIQTHTHTYTHRYVCHCHIYSNNFQFVKLEKATQADAKAVKTLSVK